jgi:hypothetical protein
MLYIKTVFLYTAFIKKRRGYLILGFDSSPQLPELLAALKRKEDSIRLDDGYVGILPEEWPWKHGVLAGLGTDNGDHLRFSRYQAERLWILARGPFYPPG